MGAELVRGRTTKILVLNPNSSKAMTDGLKPVIDSIDLSYVRRYMLLLCFSYILLALNIIGLHITLYFPLLNHYS